MTNLPIKANLTEEAAGHDNSSDRMVPVRRRQVIIRGNLSLWSDSSVNDWFDQHKKCDILIEGDVESRY